MLIVYMGETEVLVTVPENESLFLEEYFEKGKRDTNDYDREIVEDNVAQILVSCRLKQEKYYV